MHETALALSHLIETSRLSIFLQNLKNEVQITQSIHLLGICLIVGSSAMIDLRMLGLLNRDQPVRATIGRFMPPLWGGLAVVVATGLVMILTEPSRALPAIQFQFKMVMLALAVLVTVSLQKLAAKEPDANRLPVASRMLAAASLGLWAVIIAAGRWIAYA